ncbi:MAG: AAA family ATPase [Chloroflexota bacterium]|nr:AAA family ATPase [Chloroflexota bacterium]
MWKVVGHDQAVTFLDRSLRNGRLSHAYLLVGPPSVGKMRLAIDLAKALNCEGDERPCDACTQCTRIEQGKHADVQVIGVNSKTEIGMGQLKDMQHLASLRPFEGRRRVFVIDGADLMSREATNRLLKTLEEPPPDVQFILLATTEKAVLPTVRSRCHKLELRPLPVDKVSGSLAQRWGTEPERAELLARLCCGCLGWAVRALEDERVVDQRSERLASLLCLGTEGRTERFAFAAQLAYQFARDREPVRELLSLWTGWWRDLLLVKSGCGDLVSNVDHSETLQQEAQAYSLRDIHEFMRLLYRALTQLEQNASPRLVLEVLTLGMPQREEQLCQR